MNARPEPATPHVVTLGPVPPFLADPLRREHGALPLEEANDASAAEVVVTTWLGGLGAAEMDRLPGLRAIVHFGVGVDSTDVAEARRRGIAVANTPDVLTDCVADVAVGLVIDVMRGLSAADRFVRRGEWAAGQAYPLTRRVTGARVGILGLGRIGLAVAQRLEAFGCRLSYHARSEKDVPWAYAGSAVELAESCEVLVVATSGGPESKHLVDAVVLEALGPDGFLVNVARGSVVDEGALVRALEEGRIAGAGLDVFADEPHVPAALLDRDDVVLLPHLASGTVETRQAMADLVMENVRSVLATGRPVTPLP